MGFNIKTSKEVGEFIVSVYQRVNARNKAVLCRAGLFVGLNRGLPERFKSADSQGEELSDSTIIGDDLGPMIKAAINFRSGENLDEIEYRKQFKLYIEYGCLCLKQIWEDAGEDQTIFIAALLKEGSFVSDTKSSNGHNVFAQKIVNQPVSLAVLKNTEPWIINASGGNGITVISGRPGTGKSQLALDLLAQIAHQGVRFLFFDLKGELEDNPANQQQVENRKAFFEATGANYTSLISSGLPINPLFKGKTATEDVQIATEMAMLVKSFASQLSPIQERGIRDAFEDLDRPDFHGLVEALEARDQTGVGYSVIEKIVKFNLFANADEAIPIEEWLSQSQVIDFKPLGNDNSTKALTVALILNFIMRQLNHILPVVDGIQPLQMVLFVDEAHLLLPKEGKSGLLGSLARQGRSWGFPIWLASQDADSFITTGANETNFIQLADCGIHFSPQNLSEKDQKSILGKVITKSLEKGEAVLRLGETTSIGLVRQYYRDFGKQ
jgi:hypothetical protein